jgi:hypothetical protein
LQQHGHCFVTATNNSQEEGTYAEGICHGTIILQGKINKGVVLGLRGSMDFEPVVDGLRASLPVLSMSLWIVKLNV